MATVEEPIRLSLDTCSPPTTLSVSESAHSEAPFNGNGPKLIAICGVGLRLPGGIRNCDGVSPPQCPTLVLKPLTPPRLLVPAHQRP